MLALGSPCSTLCRRQRLAHSWRLGSAVRAMSGPTASMPPLQQLHRWLDFLNTAPDDCQDLQPWNIGTYTAGFVTRSFASRLAEHRDVFEWGEGQDGRRALQLRSDLTTCQQRTAAVARVTEALRRAGLVAGWRDELYPVRARFHAPPLCLVERAATPWLGVKSYGVHMNGFVGGSRGDDLRLWVATRSHAKATYPGRRDHLVAGGQVWWPFARWENEWGPVGISCRENLLKECWEEAGIAPDLADRATPVGCVSYRQREEEGLKQHVLMCYDLELPADFEPTPQDGEVESFELLPVADVAHLVATTDSFKDNCNLVIIDFLVRHGFLKPDMEGYLELVSGLRRGDCT